MAGDSAGGHIAALMAHKYRSVLDFQILIYPCVDNTGHVYPSVSEFDSKCYLLTPKSMQFMIDIYVDEPEMVTSPDVSPILASDFDNLPKCLIISAEMDMLTDSGRAYHEKISASKSSSSEYHVIEGTIHGFFSSGLYVKNAFEKSAQLILDFLINKI